MVISEARLHQLSGLLTKASLEGASGVLFHPSQLIGEGGQGWVYRAGYDEPDGPWVVVKVLRPDVVNEEAIARFLREADVLRKLGQSQAPSPNVVRFYDHGLCKYTMPDGEIYALPFTVLEYVNGMTLAQILAQTPGRGLAVPRVRRLFHQIGRALTLIHQAQIVHRDLKPSNLLIATEAAHEVAKITDFGLVKRFDVDSKGTMALAGASVGYAPPEQFELGNKRVSPRTDLFSFAAVLYEALTGRAAFSLGHVDSPFQVLSRVLSGPRPQLSGALDGLPPELAERRDLIVALDRELERATRADPGERHESIREFWDLVEPLLRQASERLGAGTAKIPAQPPPQSPPLPQVLKTPAPMPVPASLAAGAPASPAAARPSEPSSTPKSSGSGEYPSARVAEAAAAGGSLVPPAMSVARAPGLPVRDLVAPAGGFVARQAAALPDRAWSMAFGPEARVAYALGRFGLVRCESGVWGANLLPAALDPATVRGVMTTPAGELVVYGDRGTLWGQGPDGALRPWAAPDEIHWQHASLVPHPAEILLIGEHAAQRRPVLGLLRPGQPLTKRPIENVGKLNAATRLVSGGILVCGDNGELLFLGNGPPVPIPWGRTGHLMSITASLDGGAHVVGSGGHALFVTPLREAKLEPVQTTRDLTVVAMGPAATPWAGGQDARLLKRTLGGWVRAPLPPAAQGSVKAIFAGPSVIHVMLDDGAIFEGPA